MKNFPYFIAYRYFRSKKKKRFINIISILSMIAVGVGTMALVVVLSVFNGLEDFIRSLYNSFDPDLKVVAATGKSFEKDTALFNEIKTLPEVDYLTEVVEDNAFIKYRDGEMVAKVKGVSDDFLEQGKLENVLVAGDVKFQENIVDYAVIGRAVQYGLSISVRNQFQAMEIFYPKKSRTTAVIDPRNMVNRKTLLPAGVFSIERNYDNYIFTNLEFAEELFDYRNKRSSLEISLKPNASTEKAQEKLKAILGDEYKILNSAQQHSELLKVLKIEKLFVYIAFSFIALASPKPLNSLATIRPEFATYLLCPQDSI